MAAHVDFNDDMIGPKVMHKPKQLRRPYIGARCTVDGLKSRADLNGRQGVVNAPSEKPGRWQVQVRCAVN